jgi:hypothetical protein
MIYVSRHLGLSDHEGPSKAAQEVLEKAREMQTLVATSHRKTRQVHLFCLTR